MSSQKSDKKHQLIPPLELKTSENSNFKHQITNLKEQIDFNNQEMKMMKTNNTSAVGDITKQLAIINDKYKKLKVESDTKIKSLEENMADKLQRYWDGNDIGLWVGWRH